MLKVVLYFNIVSLMHLWLTNGCIRGCSGKGGNGAGDAHFLINELTLFFI